MVLLNGLNALARLFEKKSISNVGRRANGVSGHGLYNVLRRKSTVQALMEEASSSSKALYGMSYKNFLEREGLDVGEKLEKVDEALRSIVSSPESKVYEIFADARRLLLTRQCAERALSSQIW